MSQVDILLGLQWGDEGKGKVVDVLAPKYDLVARFQGGPNAGHTLEFDGHKHVLHQIPSGIFRPGILNVIGNGVVLDPITFKKELEGLDSFNIDFNSQLIISNKAQLIVPTHRLLDQAYEKSKGNEKIGSTLRGIGPTYEDKVARVGLRVGDVLESDFEEKYQKLKGRHKAILDYYKFDYSSLEVLETDFKEAVKVLREMNIQNTEYVINHALDEGKRVLAEGAQGSLLDVDFGSYPFVTSSNTISAGACAGLGVSPRRIGEVFGIFKAYCTRVGSGPFPTELFGEDGENLRKKGNEFGATTGRPRRCGWLDLVALKYTCMLNGVSQLFMMKADVLADHEKVEVGTAYELNGQVTEEIPLYTSSDLKPCFESFETWASVDTQNFNELPSQLHDYIEYIESQLQIPMGLVSIGPNRSETILKSDIFN